MEGEIILIIIIYVQNIWVHIVYNKSNIQIYIPVQLYKFPYRGV